MTWAPDYVTLAELKSFLGISDTTDDTLLALWVTAASRAVDKHCGRQFGQVATAEERIYASQWDRHLCKYVAEIDDVQDVTGLTVTDDNETAVTSDTYTLWPRNAAAKGKPYERITVSCSGDLTISAKWGWMAVPSAAKVATLLQASRFAARRDSPYGVAGSPSDGSEVRLLAQLDPDVKTSLGPFRRDWWAA